MTPLQCCKCGRFIGPDGNPDVFRDSYYGGYEIGYPECGRCMREAQQQDEERRLTEERKTDGS